MWPFPKFIAHRGAGLLAPENTLAAMRCGLSYGYHAVEFDVMLSADEIPVVIHDPVFGRTIAGSGKVAEFTAEKLRAMDAGSWFDPRFAGEPVPAFHQVLDFCHENAVWMNVELKPAPGFGTITGRIATTMLKNHLENMQAAGTSGAGAPMPLISSFSVNALLAAKEVAPDIPRGFLTDAIPENWRSVMQEAGAISLHTNYLTLTKERAREIKDAGFGLLCYTVNDREYVRELQSWGVDAFCTDRIDLFKPDF